MLVLNTYKKTTSHSHFFVFYCYLMNIRKFVVTKIILQSFLRITLIFFFFFRLFFFFITSSCKISSADGLQARNYWEQNCSVEDDTYWDLPLSHTPPPPYPPPTKPRTTISPPNSNFKIFSPIFLTELIAWIMYCPT